MRTTKTAISVILVFICFESLAQGRLYEQLSDTKIIRMVIQSTLDYPISYQGHPVKKVIITGTERRVTFFYKSNSSLYGKCNCLLLNPAQCLNDVKENYTVIENFGPYPRRETVTVEFPDPHDFNNIYRSLTSVGNEAICQVNPCVKACREKVCVSFACDSEIEICYGGQFSLSVINGNIVAEARIE